MIGEIVLSASGSTRSACELTEVKEKLIDVRDPDTSAPIIAHIVLQCTASLR
jgi:hypothetical protein